MDLLELVGSQITPDSDGLISLDQACLALIRVLFLLIQLYFFCISGHHFNLLAFVEHVDIFLDVLIKYIIYESSQMEKKHLFIWKLGLT